MIEIFGIFIQFLIFLIIFSFPFTPNNLGNYFGFKKSLNFIDSHSINIIFFCYLCLLLSFLNIDLKIFFRSYFLVSIIFFIYNFKKFKFNDLSKNSLLIFAFFLVIISIFFSISQNLKFEWDGHFWFEKTLIFFNGDGIENLKDTKANPGYPHLGPYIWAFFWKNSIIELEYFGRFFYIYFYVTSIFLILNSIKNNNQYIKIFLILFFLLITYELYYFGGYQEYLIFSTLVIASRYINLINLSKIHNLRLIFLVLLLLYINIWFKNEGLVYFLIFSSFLIFFLRISLIKKILFYSFIFLLLIVQYLIKEYFIGLYQYFHSGGFSSYFIYNFTSLEILFTKIIKIFYHIVIGFVKHPLWLIIIISVGIQKFFFKDISRENKYFFSCILINLFFIIFVFISQENFDFMLKVTLDRLLFQTSGFYLILFLIVFNKIKLRL